MIRWGNYLPKPLSDYPNLYRFYQQLHNDQGVKRAMEQGRYIVCYETTR